MEGAAFKMQPTFVTLLVRGGESPIGPIKWPFGMLGFGIFTIHLGFFFCNLAFSSQSLAPLSAF